MCGRYTLSTVDGPEIASALRPAGSAGRGDARACNICPTEPIAVVVAPGEGRAVPWGLRPFRGQKFAPINVRSETATSRFSFLMNGSAASCWPTAGTSG